MVEAIESVTKEAKSGDLIITLGAGDVSSLAPVIISSLDSLADK